MAEDKIDIINDINRENVTRHLRKHMIEGVTREGRTFILNKPTTVTIDVSNTRWGKRPLRGDEVLELIKVYAGKRQIVFVFRCAEVSENIEIQMKQARDVLEGFENDVVGYVTQFFTGESHTATPKKAKKVENVEMTILRRQINEEYATW